MKILLQLEELAMTVVGIYLLSIYNLDLSIWVWILLFFAPDVGMVGYLVNNQVGAITYNLFHHKGVALGVAAAGYLLQEQVLISIGILLFTHSSFDRVFGYGLKYETGFKYTHLGEIGK